MPPRHLGEGVYGGRDALHMAVSDDEGRTWRGFREIYLDHRRNDNPAKSGDRGTAYPLGAYTEDGQFVVIAGQGAGGRNPILIDPNWIVATTAETDFADGLKQWATYTHFGPARRWWRARRGGSRLVPHPDNPQRHCLHVRKQSDLPPDGATWNFPNGWQGTLTARVMLRDGFGGHSISLTDRFFDPANDLGEELSVFQAVISPNGKIADVQLPTEAWVTLKFHWDLNQSICQLEVDGKLAQPLALRHPTLNGVSYIRLRSTAEQTDSGGLLVDSVRVDISAPHTPPRTADELFVHEQRYVKNVVPRWAEVGK